MNAIIIIIYYYYYYYYMSASCTKSTLGTTAPCSTAQHKYSTNIDIRVSIKVMADGGQQQMIQITSSTFYQLPSLLSHLSIHHNHHLSIINLSILDLSSVKYLHLVTKSSTYNIVYFRVNYYFRVFLRESCVIVTRVKKMFYKIMRKAVFSHL